jgi:hypothetical protein
MSGDNQMAKVRKHLCVCFWFYDILSVYFVRCLTHTLWSRISTLCPYHRHPIILTLSPVSIRVLPLIHPRDGRGTVGDIGMFISTLLTWYIFTYCVLFRSACWCLARGNTSGLYLDWHTLCYIITPFWSSLLNLQRRALGISVADHKHLDYKPSTRASQASLLTHAPKFQSTSRRCGL